jgi:antagonist of KipI
MAALRLRRPGLLTTVQDLGRPGLGRFGVSVSGAMDPLALVVANRLVGNPDGAAALECTAAGPELEALVDLHLALAGADLSPTLDDEPVEMWRAVFAGAGSVLAFGPRRRGARCYVAVAGGLAVPAVLGSGATDLGAAIGGVAGRALRTGDELSLGTVPAGPERHLHPVLLRAWADPFTLRFVPEDGGPCDVAAFTGPAWRVSASSDRTGYRLDGPALPVPGGATMVSEPIAPGTIQLPPDGRPIVLMADRQTVGGYPRLGAVIAADLPKAGQLWLGHEVRFVAVTAAGARAALAEQQALLAHGVTA